MVGLQTLLLSWSMWPISLDLVVLRTFWSPLKWICYIMLTLSILQNIFFSATGHNFTSSDLFRSNCSIFKISGKSQIEKVYRNWYWYASYHSDNKLYDHMRKHCIFYICHIFITTVYNIQLGINICNYKKNVLILEINNKYFEF